VALVVVVTVPVAAIFHLYPVALISVLTDDPAAVRYGADYLRVVAFGVPFAGLNLIGSRALIGADDSWTAMVLRASGAVVNIGLNAVFIFGLDMGVVGAALGTVASNVVVVAAFAVGLTLGRLPGVGAFPVTVSPHRALLALGDLPGRRRNRAPGRRAELRLDGGALPAAGVRRPVRVAGGRGVHRHASHPRHHEHPRLGFGLAASSLVGQELGRNDEDGCLLRPRIVVFSVATYVLFAAVVAVFARDIVVLFVESPNDPSVPIAVGMVYAAAVAVIPQGVNAASAGALDATGDTRWPFYGRVLGMFGLAIPLVYLGATTRLGILGIYLSFFAESGVPAAVNYYRFATGKWKAISRSYRPDAAADD